MSDTKYRMGFSLDLTSPSRSSNEEDQQVTNREVTMNIAILGDFSAQSKAKPLVQRRFIEIDRDNFEQVLASYNIKLQLQLNSPSNISIAINELDDFHPDQLYSRLDAFAQLRSLRQRLLNKKTFAAAVEEIQGWLVPTDDDRYEPAAANIPAESLFDSVLATSTVTQNNTATSSTTSMIDDLVRQIVAPYVEPATDPRQEEMLAAVDTAIESYMQSILHHPEFQTVEATWTALWFLLKRTDSSSKVKFYLLDVSRDELLADLTRDSFTQSALYRLLCNRAPGDIDWSLFLGNFTFSDCIDDVLLLSQLGAIAQAAKAPFLAAAKETFAGCKSLALTPDEEDWDYQLKPGIKMAWQILRQSSAAKYLGLVMPRFLLRSPYGKKSNPIDSFQFEEITDSQSHHCYLWGNGAFLKAEQLIRICTHPNWPQLETAQLETGHLPIHCFSHDGETVIKPCAEILLTEQGGRKLHSQGLIPLWSVKNSDVVRSSDFHSLAQNGENLLKKFVFAHSA